MKIKIAGSDRTYRVVNVMYRDNQALVTFRSGSTVPYERDQIEVVPAGKEKKE